LLGGRQILQENDKNKWWENDETGEENTKEKIFYFCPEKEKGGGFPFFDQSFDEFLAESNESCDVFLNGDEKSEKHEKKPQNGTHSSSKL